MKTLYKLNIDCGRMGDLRGIFVADDADMLKLLDSKRVIHWGEVLGKHSDVRGCLESNEIKMLTQDQDFIAKFEEYGASSGYNPFRYLENE